MSSPSSTGSAKRKRTTPAERLKSSSTGDMLQASSQDASGEELAEVPSTRQKKHSSSISDNVPPSKRARTRQSTEANGAAPEADSKDAEYSADPEEEAKQARRNAASERRLKEPLRAGLRDPIGGYKTNPPPTGRPVRIYADGVFDLFHLGHMRQLEQAKNAFPDTYLLVGVTGDAETHKRKGLTVLTGAERAETVRHCKWVDEVIPNCPWIVTNEFLAEHNIDYVAHDDEPYGASEGDDIYAPIKKEGKFLVTERTEGVSTTGIITKIVRDYEKYIARQLKRGTSRQELNISWLKKNELDIKRHVAELRDSIKTNWTSAGGEVGRDLKQFWQASRPSSPAPGQLGRSSSSGNLRSPTGVEHLKHLEVPGAGSGGSTLRIDSPQRLSRSEDFAAGYSLGLIGGVKSWMMRGNKSLRGTNSQLNSPSGSGSETDEARSPDEAGDEKQLKTPSLKTPARGRRGKLPQDADEMEV